MKTAIRPFRSAFCTAGNHRRCTGCFCDCHTDREPTEQEIGESDPIATVFIEREIHRLTRLLASHRHLQWYGKQCRLCFGWSMAIGALQAVLGAPPQGYPNDTPYHPR